MKGHEGRNQGRRSGQEVEDEALCIPPDMLKHEDRDAKIPVEQGVEQKGEAACPLSLEGAAGADQ